MGDIDPNLPHYDVRVFVSSGATGPDADKRIAELLSLPPDAYSTDLNAVVREIMKRGWWWHLSHLEASVVPTSPAPGMEGLVSNAGAYDREGRAIDYTSQFPHLHGPARCLCEAWIKATFDLPTAFAVQASAIEEALKREPESKKSRMAYYRAREEIRQSQIKEMAKRRPALSPEHERGW